eukprot:TRINITY_DN7620_c0_g1_i1.p1 TRINITY_DN7620_c0_g1~~TRINITY_DN7620_c0_g1_i1.p1  ORF type:complete len:558 (+),score=178.70 TRINITY_DN7620_c0_g1_i1:51-1724(+)
MVFTGLVSGMGKGGFEAAEEGTCKMLRVTCEGWFKGVELGDSIAVNGCCLTVVKVDDDSGWFQVMQETLRLTALEDKEIFNIEKAMVHDASRLGGHVVQGHVHGVGTLASIHPVPGDDSVLYWFEIPPVPKELSLKHKGSIAINGVSLTIAEISPDRTKVKVSIIPHTRKVTTFGILQQGDKANIEFDCNSNAEGAAKPLNTDHDFMLEAVKEGNKGRLTAPPNPWVGCVIVKHGVIIGRGYHIKAGTPHAEVQALNSVEDKELLKGATCYCTLEPCSHHGRTGPCCEAVTAAGITRCVIGVLDPDEKVSGKGVKYMESKGISVTVNVATAECEESLKSYLYQRRYSMPYVVIKTATTLDGCVACADGTSKWITGPEARTRGHLIRAQSQAIIVGSSTVLADNPQLTVRRDDVPPDHQPLRVVLDRRGRVTDPSLNLLADTHKTLIFTEAGTMESTATVEVLKGAFTLTSVLKELASRGILQAMVEGGGALHTSFLQEALFNELYLFQGATFFGEGGRKWLQQPLCSTISEAKFLKLESVSQLGNDTMSVFSVRKKE